MKKTHPTWSVVATVDESPALIQAFVAWYLHLGASEVSVYFDQPDDPAAKMVAAIPGVRVTRCDDAHWAALGRKRPHRHQIRQRRNATDAYRRMTTDWLLHVDADEYLLTGRPVDACLAQADPGVPCVAVPVAERIHTPGPQGTIFAGAFRRQFPGKPDAGRALFGPHYDMTHRGLTGHSVGKSFTHAGHPLEISIHRPKPKGPDAVPVQTIAGMELLHFDGLTRLQWVYKLLRAADALLHRDGMPPSRHRQRQIAAVLLQPRKGFVIYDRIKQVTPDLKAQLDALDLWFDPRFDPAAALAQVFPGVDVDLSPEAADAWLWRQKGDVLRQYGVQPNT